MGILLHGLPHRLHYAQLVTTGSLKRYAAKIKAYARQYPACWGIIYQADVRMRSEHFLRIKATLEEEDDQAKEDNTRSPLSKTMPWDSVFRRATEGSEKWWADNCKDPCHNVSLDLAKVGDYVDGDVKAGSPAATTATGSDMMAPIPITAGDFPPQPVPNTTTLVTRHRPDKRPSTPPNNNRIKQVKASGTADLSHWDGSKWTLNKHGEQFCGGYQFGSCATVCTDGLHCGVNHDKVHQCELCKRTGHGASTCWMKVAAAEQNYQGGAQPRKGKKGGKGGKGGKLKGSGKG